MNMHENIPIYTAAALPYQPLARMRSSASVVGSVCVSVKSHLTSGAFVPLKILSCTQQATEVKQFVGFSLKPLHCRDPERPYV